MKQSSPGQSMTAPDSTAELLTDVSSSAIHNDHWDEINGLEGRL